MIGAVPTTTYGENIGVMAITGVYSVYVIAGAAVISMLMASSARSPPSFRPFPATSSAAFPSCFTE